MGAEMIRMTVWQVPVFAQSRCVSGIRHDMDLAAVSHRGESGRRHANLGPKPRQQPHFLPIASAAFLKF
jgi:hypothetical protein